MIDIEPHPEGAILPLRARAGSRTNSLRGEHGGAVKVSVTQVAEKGKANQAIIGVLAEALGLRRSQVQLIGGETSPRKRFLIREISVDQLREKLAAALPPNPRQ